MKKLKRKEYEKHLEPLQQELVAMTRWLQHCGKRVVVVIEGRDTAGKGGVINAISQYSIRASATCWRWPSPASARAPSGISSATSRTCRPQASYY